MNKRLGRVGYFPHIIYAEGSAQEKTKVGDALHGLLQDLQSTLATPPSKQTDHATTQSNGHVNTQTNGHTNTQMLTYTQPQSSAPSHSSTEVFSPFKSTIQTASSAQGTPIPCRRLGSLLDTQASAPSSASLKLGADVLEALEERKRKHAAKLAEARRQQEKARAAAEEERRRVAEEKARREREEAEKQRQQEERQRQEAEQRRQDAERKVKESEEAEKKAKEDAEKSQRIVVDEDVHAALLNRRRIIDSQEVDTYKEFLASTDPAVKNIRVIIKKKCGALRNQISSNKQSIVNAFRAVTMVKDEVKTVTLDGITVKMEPYGDVPVCMAYFLHYLTDQFIENAVAQMDNNFETVWTYGTFLAMLRGQWSDVPQLMGILESKLAARSTWAIPYPSSDRKIRLESSNKDLVEWCKRTSALFALRLSIYVNSKEGANTVWTLVSRLFNRLSPEKMLKHPIAAFIAQYALSVAEHQLATSFPQAYQKLVMLIRDSYLTVWLAIANTPDTWKDVRVPLSALQRQINTYVQSGGRTQPPAGSIMIDRESAIVDD